MFRPVGAHGDDVVPYGFEDGRITIRPDEADTISALVARFLAGVGLLSLAKWLDEQEIRTVFGKPWRTTTFRDVMISGRIAGLR